MPGRAKLSTGTEVDVPFECRRADALLIVGTVSLEGAQKMVAGEAHPIALRDQRAPAVVWAMNYLDTTCGPYTEIISTLLVRDGEAAPLALDGPWELMALALEPGVRGFIHRLLLPESAKDAIAYGREMLHLDKTGCERIEISQDPFVPVRRVDAFAGGHVALRIRVGIDDTFKTRRQSGWGMLKAAGLKALQALVGGAHMVGQAPRRMGGGLIDCTLSGSVYLQPWAKGDECVATDATELTAELKEAAFVPKVVQRVPEMKFVMSLRPGPSPSPGPSP